ncbi:transposase, partial [Acinetobacter guerrae]
MAKYSQEFKLEVVHHYLSGHGGYRATARYFNIDQATVRKWLLTYKLHGEHGLLRQTKKSNYSPEFKLEVVLCIMNEGLSSREVVKRFKLKERHMAMTWLHQYQAH